MYIHSNTSTMSIPIISFNHIIINFNMTVINVAINFSFSNTNDMSMLLSILVSVIPTIDMMCIVCLINLEPPAESPEEMKSQRRMALSCQNHILMA